MEVDGQAKLRESIKSIGIEDMDLVSPHLAGDPLGHYNIWLKIDPKSCLRLSPH